MKNLSRPKQEKVIQWCESGRNGDGLGGVPYAQEMLARDGIEVWPTSIRRFRDWFRLRAEIEAAREHEDLIDIDPASMARSRACSQKLLLDLALARQDPKLLAMAAAVVDRQRRLDLLEARDLWRQRDREQHRKQTFAFREKTLRLARDKFEDSKMRYERAHPLKPTKPKGLTPETLRQIEEAAKML